MGFLIGQDLTENQFPPMTYDCVLKACDEKIAVTFPVWNQTRKYKACNSGRRSCFVLWDSRQCISYFSSKITHTKNGLFVQEKDSGR